jgi:hypothetical protein
MKIYTLEDLKKGLLIYCFGIKTQFIFLAYLVNYNTFFYYIKIFLKYYYAII